jgi:hypothetical protein
MKKGCATVAGLFDDFADHERLKSSAGGGGGELGRSDSSRPSLGGEVPPGK